MTTRATRSPRRRTVVALALVLVILAAFVVRLVDIQVVNANDHIDESQALATGAKQTLYGARGEIVDTNGTVTLTQNFWLVFIGQFHVSDPGRHGYIDDLAKPNAAYGT